MAVLRPERIGGAESALVLGNYRPSLTVIRTLSRTGFRVIVGEGGEYSKVHHSRHCDEVWRHPDIQSGAEFLDRLASFLNGRQEIALIFPVSQSAVAFLAQNRSSLPAHVTLVAPSADLVATCLDKTRMLEIATRAGVPHERYALPHSLASLTATARNVGYPCIVRPVGSGPERLPDGQKVLICPEPTTLARAFPEWPSHHSTLLVQHFSPGPRHNIYFAAREGRMLASVETQILRTDRINDTGLAVEGVSVFPDPQLSRHGAVLVQALQYTGVGCVQFLKPPDGAAHFLELNPRLGAAFAIVHYCGLDLTTAACDLATGRSDRDPPIDFHYPAGRRFAWSFGDIQGMRRALENGEIGTPDAIWWSLRAIRAALQADVHLTWSVKDPKPTLALYAHWARLGPSSRRNLIHNSPREY